MMSVRRPLTRLISLWVAATAIIVCAAGATWYRYTFHVWPGQSVGSSILWCERDYRGPGRTFTLAEIQAVSSYPVTQVMQYPPINGKPVFATITPPPIRNRFHSPCAMGVYVKVSQDEYVAYAILGGP